MYRERFPGKSVFPVIHIGSLDQINANLLRVEDAKVAGVFLIKHGPSEISLEKILEILQVEGWFERLWIGANFLSHYNSGDFAAAHRFKLGGVWLDNIHALSPQGQHDFDMRQQLVKANADRDLPSALVFGGIAFKYQISHGDGTEEAKAAMRLADVVTTSGPETGRPADLEKLQAIRDAIGDHPLATASGVTPENAADQFRYVDAVLVATGINHEDDFFNIDPGKLRELVAIAHELQPPVT